jgi:hypothetical protein
MFGEVGVHLFFGVPKIYFNPAFEASAPYAFSATHTKLARFRQESLARKAAQLFRTAVSNTVALRSAMVV